MGLYLCVFAEDDADEDLDGVEMGGYDDFGDFRRAVAEQLEGGRWGSRFPTLMNHPDSAGDWTAADCTLLIEELSTIRAELAALPAPPYQPGWQAEAAKEAGHQPGDHATFFIDPDGEVLIDRLLDLGRLAIGADRSISFM